MELNINDEVAGTLTINLTSGGHFTLEVVPWSKHIARKVAKFEKLKVNTVEGVQDAAKNAIRVLAPSALDRDLEKIPLNKIRDVFSKLVTISVGAEAGETKEEKKTRSVRRRRK